MIAVCYSGRLPAPGISALHYRGVRYRFIQIINKNNHFPDEGDLIFVLLIDGAAVECNTKTGSDSSGGQLLFYSVGQKCYWGDNALMPNGSGLSDFGAHIHEPYGY